MGFHSFSLDPRTVLGVGPGASLEEIREAYRAKSKKHHPDVGGDEWAFRMVARAYEVLKTTAEASASATARPWESRGAGPEVVGTGRPADWSWNWGSRFGQPGRGPVGMMRRSARVRPRRKPSSPGPRRPSSPRGPGSTRRGSGPWTSS